MIRWAKKEAERIVCLHSGSVSPGAQVRAGLAGPAEVSSALSSYLAPPSFRHSGNYFPE